MKFHGKQYNASDAPRTVDELMFTERQYKELHNALLLFAEHLDTNINCGKNKSSKER